MSYPVFKISETHDLLKEGSVIYTYSEYVDEENNHTKKVKVLDDTSIPATTLGLRRLKLMEMGVPLVKLSKAIYFFGGLLSLANRPGTKFIDSRGIIFKYAKTRFVPLEFRKITRKFSLPNSSGTLIEVDGIPQRFKTVNTISDNYFNVAGLLNLKNHYILYGLYNEMMPTTYRKV